MEESFWESATLVVKVREGVSFQDGTTLTAHSVTRAFDEVQKWKAPHPPAVIHREYFHTLGAFRAGPPVPEFEELMARSVVETDAQKLTDLGKQIDRLVYDDALSVFLCCPMALVAVNRYVKFTGHAATLELAETEVTEEHWSRR
jgi:peptide/nickel transport system substrate-binding protein